jgi:hypothetical protein
LAFGRSQHEEDSASVTRIPLYEGPVGVHFFKLKGTFLRIVRILCFSSKKFFGEGVPKNERIRWAPIGPYDPHWAPIGPYNPDGSYDLNWAI